MLERKPKTTHEEIRLPERPAEGVAPAESSPSRKGDLSLEQIKEWVDAYRMKNDGRFPSVETGPVVTPGGSATGETWRNLDQILRVTQDGRPARGLQDTGFSSLADFLDKTYPAERKQELSIDRIKEWVDAHRAKNDGKFPTVSSGPVVHPDGSTTGERWDGINNLLRSGQKGQRARGLQDSGFLSLADFLDRTYPTERKQELSTARVKEWVDTYRAKNDGKFPSVRTGTVVNADGSATGETWHNLDQLLRATQDGRLARGLQNTGFSSLSDFLDKTYPGERTVKVAMVEKRVLSLEQIKEWVDVYRAMNDGKFPSVNTGPVVNADGSASGETWRGINHLLATGQRGRLARGLQNTGFSSLSDFLDKTYSGEREVRVEKGDLSLEQIKEWVDAYRVMNGGKFPSQETGPVVKADGSATGETWKGLSQLLRKGQEGRFARGLQDTGFLSLADFLDRTYPTERTQELSIDRVKEWVDAYRAKNDGNFPSVHTGPVVNADGSASGETWAGISNLLRRGQEGKVARGLQNTGFSSLSDFLDKTYPTERAVKVKERADRPTSDDINVLLDLLE